MKTYYTFYMRVFALILLLCLVMFPPLPSRGQDARTDSIAVPDSAEQKPAAPESREETKKRMLPELDEIRARKDSVEGIVASASDSLRAAPDSGGVDSSAAIPDSLPGIGADSAGTAMTADDSLDYGRAIGVLDTASLVALIVMPAHLDVITNGVEKLVGLTLGKNASLIPGEEYEWSSNIDGVLGRGRELVVARLSTGVHQLRLGIRHGGGELAADSIHCVVMDQYINVPPEVVNRPPLTGTTSPVFGEIIMGVLLNEEGRVSDARIVENTTGNDSLALHYLSRTREMTYTPAREGASPREAWIANSLYFDGVQAPDEIVATAPDLLLAIRREEVDLLRSQSDQGSGMAGSGLLFNRAVSENSQKAITYLFPKRLLPVPLRLAKNEEALAGELAAVIKINRMGLVKELLVLDNTTNQQWVEDDFVAVMARSVFEPMYDPAGPNDRLVHSVFKIQGENLIPQDVGGEEEWKEKYQYRFASIETGGEPDYSREPKVRVAAGYFRLKVPVFAGGHAQDLKELEKNLNENDLKDLAEKVYKDNTYIPAQVNGKPKSSYLFPLYSFENYDNNYYLRLLRPYNNGYYYLLNKEFKKALGNFEELNRRDLSGEILGMYGQYAHCAEQTNKYAGAFAIFEAAIFKFACMKNLTALNRMAVEYEAMKTAYRTNTPFYELMYGGFDNLYAYHSFLPQTSLPKIKGVKEPTIQKVEYPEEVKKSGAEGTVMVAAMIDNNGMVKEIGIQNSFGAFACERDALKQAKRQDYDAALIGTDPVTSWVSLPARYRYLSPIFQLASQSLPLQAAQRPDSLYIKPGLPQILIEGQNNFSKAKDTNEGYIRAALIINNRGLITDIMLLENTLVENAGRAESELVTLLAGTFFDPATVVRDSSHRVAYVATFIIDENKRFSLPEDTRLSLYVDKRDIIFPVPSGASEPDFTKTEEVNEAFGGFRMQYRITEEGKTEEIQTLFKEINKEKLIDIAKDTFEGLSYTPGTYGDSLKVAYKILGYGFSAQNAAEQLKLVKDYNEGYKKLIKNDYSGAGKKFGDVISRDRTGDFYRLIPQMLLSFRRAGEIQIGYETFNNLLRVQSLTKNLTKYEPLARLYLNLRYHAALNNDYYAIMTDSISPKVLFELPPPNTKSAMVNDLESIWKELEYPKKKEEEVRYGTVEVMALIDEKQEIKSIELLHSLGDNDYDDRAKDAVKKYARFSSAMYNGSPVPYWCSIPIKFEKPVTPEDMIPWWKEEIAPPDSTPDLDSIIVVSKDDTAASALPDSAIRLKSAGKKNLTADSISAWSPDFPLEKKSIRISGMRRPRDTACAPIICRHLRIYHEGKSDDRS